ncbi:MAG: DUF4445 domain-containing protein [Clostridia bacterium]|nr:DUF4445 domain-containing protein [Clostridia bacterium]
MKHKVTINGKIYFIDENGSLYDAVSAAGFSGACGGRGRCGKCKVRVAGDVSDITDKELKILTADEIKNGVRLACSVYVKGDCAVTFDASGEAQIETDGELRDHVLSPVFDNYGVSVDIGTTTVALRLYDKKGALVSEQSCLNPENIFGADVISRMEAAISGKSVQIANSIRSGLNELIKKAADSAKIDSLLIDAAVITGNTAMLYLLTGDDVEPMTHAPFTVKNLYGRPYKAAGIGLSSFSDDTAVYFPPCVSAFIGADTVCALLSSYAYDPGKINVLTDIGTNNETVLNNKGVLYACSTAAGPAFEGAGISCGMGGSAGAVDKVRLGSNGYSVHVIGETEPAGICGSGIIDAVACMLEKEDLDETGYLEEDVMIAGNVTITQNDIRAIQLAKGAVHAGIKTLLKTSGVDCNAVDTLYIAGGFGSFLDKENAAKIGLIPYELKDKVVSCGNAALSGASLILLSAPLKKECELLASKISTVSLASNPLFVNEYTESMLF